MRAIQRARTVTYVENAICHSLPLLATFDPRQCVFGPKVANWPSEERGENLAACHCLKIVSAQMATNSGNSGKGGNSGNVTKSDCLLMPTKFMFAMKEMKWTDW